MFVFNRSAAAVLVPLALLIAVVWSSRASAPQAEAVSAAQGTRTVTVAQVESRPTRQP